MAQNAYNPINILEGNGKYSRHPETPLTWEMTQVDILHIIDRTNRA